MSQYRKKPVVIEAAPVRNLVIAANNDWRALPQWVADAYERGELIFLHNAIDVNTLEGTMHAGIDDMLIQGVKGESYPCKPDIFAATYEPAP